MNSSFRASVILVLMLLGSFILEKGYGQMGVADKKFSLDAFDYSIRENPRIDFNDYKNVTIQRSPDAEIEHWVEYKTSFLGLYTVSDQYGTRSIFSTLLENVIDENQSEFTLLKFQPSFPLDSAKEYAYFQLNDFSGTIYCYNQMAVMEYIIGVTDGRVQDFSETK